MSFLTPLYLLGALAVSLPILFHMIRRTPRDRREFSSTMFLQPSPPKVTRRSRIEHWLLLLLRSLAVCLLALAFARPFWRQSLQDEASPDDTRATVILLDRSASMRRDGLWEAATREVESILADELEPGDQAAVLAFDETLQPVCDFQHWSTLDPAQRAGFVLSTLGNLSPSWSATDLGAALIESAEQLDALVVGDEVAERRTIIVVSDFQSGCSLESLQGYDWPGELVVQLHRLDVPVSSNNAGIHPVGGTRTESEQPLVRVRVSTAEGADRDEFTLRWADEFENSAADRGSLEPASTVSVIVPAGQSRIVRAPARDEGLRQSRIVLEGDDHEFDNHCYLPPPRVRTVRIAIIGRRAEPDPHSLEYYVPPAFPPLSHRKIEIVDWDEMPQEAHLAIVVSTESPEILTSLRDYIADGGTVLFAGESPDDYTRLFTQLGMAPITVREGEVDDYRMLTSIEYSHPFFAPLSDSRFSDFTKVRFWNYRIVSLEGIPSSTALARFDNGDAAVIESRIGEGRLIMLTSGWHPRDSQLAVSTKFVPMLNGLVDELAGIGEYRTSFLVGERVPLAEFRASADELTAIELPSGEQVAVEDDMNSFSDTVTPGLYTLISNGSKTTSAGQVSFAVNLDSSESQVSPLSDAELAAAGVALKSSESVAVLEEAAQRQLRAGELENRQKLWQWLVLSVMAILIAETLLASRAARRQSIAPV